MKDKGLEGLALTLLVSEGFTLPKEFLVRA